MSLIGWLVLWCVVAVVIVLVWAATFGPDELDDDDWTSL